MSDIEGKTGRVSSKGAEGNDRVSKGERACNSRLRSLYKGLMRMSIIRVDGDRTRWTGKPNG